MAKRVVNFFANIKSDESLDELLLHDSLIILDVFQEIYGPCSSSLHAILERAKLALSNSDMIQLAVCAADKIEKLKRFRFKSHPQILFCLEGKVVDVLYEANIPLLQQKIQSHLEAYEKKDEIELDHYEFEQPLPFEQIVIDRIRAEKDELDRIAKETADNELKQELDEVIKLMSEYVNEFGITLFMPHALDGALKKTLKQAQRLQLNTRTRKMVKITQDMMKTLNYNLENPMDEEVMNYLYEKELLIVMWSGDPRRPIEVDLTTFVDDVTKSLSTDGDDGPNSQRVSQVSTEGGVLEPLIIYLDEDDVESSSLNQQNEEEVEKISKENLKLQFRLSENTPRSSNRRSTMKRPTEDSTLIDREDIRPKLVVPPVWAPLNQAGNFMFMFTFFREQFEHFLPPVKVPEPPHVCMIFPAANRDKVFEISESFPKQLLISSFFSWDSHDLKDCKLICKTAEKYDEMSSESSDKIIVKLARQNSAFELALIDAGPVYISQNTSEGAEECSLIFNEDFHQAEDILDAENDDQSKKD